MFNKLIKLGLCSITLLTMTACGNRGTQKPKTANDIDFKSSEFKDISDIENANYVKDAQLFDKINRLSIKIRKVQLLLKNGQSSY